MKYNYKTGTTNEQSQKLINAGLDETTADLTFTIKIPGSAEGPKVIRAWSLAKLLTFFPADENHGWALRNIGSDIYELNLNSKTDKYKKSIKGNDYIDVTVEGILYLMTKKKFTLNSHGVLSLSLVS